MLSVDTGQMKCPKWLSWLCCCCCCCKCRHGNDKEPLLSSETSSEYGGSADITFDNTVTPSLFTVVQESSAASKQESYQVEQSLLGSTEVQEWKVELTAADEEAISATPSQYVLEDNVTAPSTASFTVLPSVHPTGVVTSHSLVADSDHMTKVSYEFQLRRRT